MTGSFDLEGWKLKYRIACEKNKDHHMYSNRGIWCIQLSFQRNSSQMTVRRSLKTKDVVLARKRRDNIISDILLSQ